MASIPAALRVTLGNQLIVTAAVGAEALDMGGWSLFLSQLGLLLAMMGDYRQRTQQSR
jgi:hypothetical protein